MPFSPGFFSRLSLPLPSFRHRFCLEQWSISMESSGLSLSEQHVPVGLTLAGCIYISIRLWIFQDLNTPSTAVNRKASQDSINVPQTNGNIVTWRPAAPMLLFPVLTRFPPVLLLIAPPAMKTPTYSWGCGERCGGIWATGASREREKCSDAGIWLIRSLQRI